MRLLEEYQVERKKELLLLLRFSQILV